MKATVDLFLFTMVLNFIFTVQVACSGEFEVSGVHVITRTTGKTIIPPIEFTAPTAGQYYFVRLHNGIDGAEPITSSRAILNGQEIFSPNEFKRHSPFLEQALSLDLDNRLEIEIQSKPGGAYQIEVYGIDNDDPEITAHLEPAANDRGWNNTNLQVVFTCTDAISGVATCTDSIPVKLEGAEQTFTGHATDVAGNSAEVSIKLNIDKTLPNIKAQIEGVISVFGWYNSDVTLTYTCEDSLSGVEFCSEPMTLDQDGKDQQIQGRAADIASNKKYINHLVSIAEFIY